MLCVLTSTLCVTIAWRRGRLTSWRQSLFSESQTVHTAPSPGHPRSARRVPPAPSHPGWPGKQCGAGGLRCRSAMQHRQVAAVQCAQQTRLCAATAGRKLELADELHERLRLARATEQVVSDRTMCSVSRLELRRQRVQQRTLYALGQARRVSTASVRPRCVTRAVWLTAS